jgi:oligopeptide transport system ATP-binding protein
LRKERKTVSDDKKLIEVQHLQQYFPAGGRGKKKKYVQAVDDVSFYIKKGETLGLVGESGCGKTTVGRTILRLYEPTDGTIIYDGDVIFDKKKKIAVNMLPYRRKMQMVFQDPYASLDPRMTIGDIVGEAIDIHHLAANKKERRDKIISLLETVGLNSEHANRYPHEFSGGQRQAVTLMMSTLVTPKLLLLDEHTAALDPLTAEKVLDITQRIVAENSITTMMITHNIKSALKLGTRTIMLECGKSVLDLKGDERNNMTVQDLLGLYRQKSGKELDNDRMLLTEE